MEPNGLSYLKSIHECITFSYTIHRNVQGMSRRPREGAHLASKALATALTRVKFSLL